MFISNLYAPIRNIAVASLIALGSVCCFAQYANAQSAQEYIEKGNSLYNSKKYNNAVENYEKAIQLEPKTAFKAYLNCARAFSMQKDYKNSKRMYDYYFDVTGDTKDKKVAAEYKAVVKKVDKNEQYVRPESQATALVKLQSAIMSGPFVNRQNGGAFRFYDALINTGFAEPLLGSIQEDLVKGLLNEVESEIMPIEGQPLPNLDRVGWEYIRTKLARASQFPTVVPNAERVARIENTALGWEAYLRGDYQKAAGYFDTACDENHPLPAAFWGRMMTALHNDSDAKTMALIDKTEKVYQKANVTKTTAFFALMRAQVYRNQGQFDNALAELDKMNEAL